MIVRPSLLRRALLTIASSAAIVVALGARQSTPRPQPFSNGTYESSGVVEVPGGGGVLFVDDGRPKHVFWMGLAGSGADGAGVRPVPIPADVPDMEDITSDGRFIYVVGSQSLGSQKADGLVRFQFDAKTLAVTDVQRVAGLRQILAVALPDLLGGRRRSVGLNIEGLTWDAARNRLLLGLRSPMAGDDAVVVPLTMRDAAAPLSAENLDVGAIIRLPLDGRAIRGLGYDAERRLVLILAGAPTDGPGLPFFLFEWDGTARGSLRQVASFPHRLKPEGVTRVHLAGAVRTLVVFDTSGFQILD
jgi:hypothetical protein